MLSVFLSAVAIAGHDRGPYADLDIEQLMQVQVDTVFGASKYEQKVTQAPASISIITADEIRQQGHRSLAEVLRSVRGLYVSYDRDYAYFGARGFARPGDYNTRVLLLVNGHRLNDNLFGSALIGNEAVIDIDLVERIEVIRGPSSSIYGSDAFFGVINVITRNAKQIGGVEASAEAGSLDSYKGRASYGGTLDNGVDLVLSASLYDSAGHDRLYYPEFDTPETNDGVAENGDAERAQQLFARLNYGGFSLDAAYAARDKHIPTAFFGSAFNDSRTMGADERHYVDARYTHALTGSDELNARTYYDRYSFRGTYAIGAPGAVELYYYDNLGEQIGAELQWTKTLSARHRVVLGSEYRDDLDLYQATSNGNPRQYSFRDRRRGAAFGVYVQDELTVSDTLRINAGLRYDRYHSFGGTLNPRLGLIYALGVNTTAKLLYGRAYRAPNAYELYLDAPGYVKGNAQLDPETIDTYELVLEHYFTRSLRVGVSAYHYRISDLISTSVDPDNGELMFGNVDGVSATGMEWEIESRLDGGAAARLSYALQRAQDGDGQRHDNSPEHLAKLNLTLPLYHERLSAGLELQYLSAVRTFSGAHLGGFTTANLTLLGTRVLPGLDLSLSVYNLFDRDYAYSATAGHIQDAIEQDGRSLRLKATFRF